MCLHNKKNKFWQKYSKVGKIRKILLFYSKNSSFSKFCILGTFGLGHNIWSPGIPRLPRTWEIIQKVSTFLFMSIAISHCSATVNNPCLPS